MYKWEKIETNKVCLEVEVPTEEVNDALEKAYRKVVKKVSVPGFRKGKVPRKILESRYGPEIFYEDALEILVDPSYSKAVEECKLEPINRPELELIQMEKDKPLIYKATVEVKPEVELGNYKGVTIEQEKQEVTEEDIDNYLKSLLEQHAKLVTLDEGEIQEKDLAVIDFEGRVDGEVFEGGTGENYSLEIGSGTFVEGFEEQLLGAKKGDEKEIKVTFPEDYYKEELAGKDAVFNVTVKEIKRPQLPELNDAFVQELTEEFSTLEEFKADVENKIKENFQNREKVNLESRLIEKIAAEEAKVDVPKVLIERELDNMLGELGYFLRMQGLSLEQYGQLVEGGLEKLRNERREEATKRVKANLVLDAIIKKEAIEATEEEIDAKIHELLKMQNENSDMDFEKVKGQLALQGRLDVLAHEIRYRKVIDMLVENANIIKVDPKASPEESKQEENKVEENEENKTAADDTPVAEDNETAEKKE